MDSREVKPQDWDSAQLNRGKRRAIKVSKYLPKEGIHLDVGTGEGNGTLVFSHVKRTFGLDYGFASTQRARKKGIDMVNASAARMPFKSGAFHSITCLDVLEHIPNYKGALQEMHRVLGPGGLLLLQTPISEYLKERLLRLIRRHKLIRQKQPYDKPLSRERLIAELKKNQFALILEEPIRYWAKNPLVHYFSWSRLFLCRKPTSVNRISSRLRQGKVSERKLKAKRSLTGQQKLLRS